MPRTTYYTAIGRTGDPEIVRTQPRQPSKYSILTPKERYHLFMLCPTPFHTLLPEALPPWQFTIRPNPAIMISQNRQRPTPTPTSLPLPRALVPKFNHLLLPTNTPCACPRPSPQPPNLAAGSQYQSRLHRTIHSQPTLHERRSRPRSSHSPRTNTGSQENETHSPRVPVYIPSHPACTFPPCVASRSPQLVNE